MIKEINASRLVATRIETKPSVEGQFALIAREMAEQRDAFRTTWQRNEYDGRLDLQRRRALSDARQAVGAPAPPSTFLCGACGHELGSAMVRDDSRIAVCEACDTENELSDEAAETLAAPPAMADGRVVVGPRNLDEAGGDADALDAPHVLGHIRCPHCDHSFPAASSDGQSFAAKCAKCSGPLSYRDLRIRPDQARRLAGRQARQFERRNGRERPLFGDGDPVL